MHAGAFSSAFWAAAIVESEAKYDLLKSQLITLPSERDGPQIVLDGGMVETTGIASLLRHKATKVVALYNNNNGGLAKEPAAGQHKGANASPFEGSPYLSSLSSPTQSHELIRLGPR